MLGRELTYSMPLARLLTVSRVASRKVYASSWLFVALIFAVYVAIFSLLMAYDRPIKAWLKSYGLPGGITVIPIILALILAFWWLRRRGLKQLKSRADFDSAVRFREEAEGLRFATSEIEYFVRWTGIAQLLLIENHGLIVSHGNLFFLIPNEAFQSLQERNDLALRSLAKLSDAARERSEKFVKPVLDASNGTAGA